MKIDLRNATPGVHALHIHTVGQCDLRRSSRLAGTSLHRDDSTAFFTSAVPMLATCRISRCQPRDSFLSSIWSRT